VQAEAIEALGRLRDRRAVPPLAGLVGGEDASTARLAATALVRIGQSGPAERDAVLAAARGRCEASPSQALYRILGALGAPEDLDLVLAGLAAPGAADRAAAAGAMGALAHRHVADERAAPALAGALSDPAAAVRAASARALAELARSRSSRGREADSSCACESGALVRALRDPEDAVRGAAAEALGAFGRVEHAGAIAALALEPGEAPMVVVAALRALVRLGPVPAGAVQAGLAHADAEVVKEAVLAAARVAGDDGVRALRDAAASPRWDVRLAAAQAIAERGDPDLRPDAERLARWDPDPLVARAFAEAARGLGAR
jgi:HEAT repeat protein